METLLRPRPGEPEGAVARLIREHDWRGTPLGAPAGWPLPLKTLLGVMLGSNQPMFVAWGPERTLLYNDAYAEILARKHPAALGRDFLEVWHEIRGDLVPIVESAYRGEPVQMDDITLMMERRGFREETHFAFSYTPVRDEGGSIAGFFCACQEITGQVLAERRLRASEARHRLLVDSATDFAIITFDAEGIVTGWNSGAERMLGYSEEEALGLSCDILFTPEDRAAEAPAEERDKARIEGRAENERWHLRKDGSRFWGSGLAQPLEEGSGFLKIFRDRTREREADERLRASEARAREEAERVRLALDAGAIIGTWFWDLPSDRFTVDEAFARSFGLDPELGREGLSLEQVVASVHSDDLAGLRAAIAEVVERGGPYAHQYRVQRTDGRYYWIEANGRVDHGPDGTPLRFPGVLLDVEARRAAEAERDRARKLLESFVEAVPGVAYAKDREGRMLVANRGTTDLIGKPPEEYLGRTDAEFLDDPAQGRVLMENDRRIMESGVAEQVEEVIDRPDGTPSVWFSTKAPLRDDDGTVVGLIGSSIDITARKAAEAALAESEERFRFALEAAGGIGTWDWDIGADRVHTNEMFARIYGLDPERARTGMPLAEYVAGIHPADRAEVRRLIEEAMACDGGDFRAEYRVLTRDGETRWVVARGRCLRDAEGRPARFPGVTFDITDRKAAEEELRTRTAELESLLASAPLGVAFFDREHRWVRINEELAAINGFPVEDHIGRRMEELLPVNARLVGPALDRIFETGEPLRNVEVTGEVPHAPGVPRNWLVNYYPVFDASGEVTSVGTWLVDITERKLAEERARDSEARLRAVLDAAPVGLVFADAEGQITGGNARVEEILAHPILPSRGVKEYGEWVSFHPDGRKVEGSEYPLARALSGREERPELEVHYRRGDGRRAWVRLIASPVRDPEGRVAGGVVATLDIDRERRTEAELRALNETLESRISEAVAERERMEEALRQSQKMEAVGQLTGGIAHDFNNMLAAVVGSLDLLGRRIGEGDARARRYVDAAMEGARRAANLTARLLAFSRQQPLRPEPVDANRLVEGMSDLLQRSLGAGVRLETALAEGLWTAHADPNQLENVLLNLAVNARDAMPEGGRLVIETANADLESRFAAGHLGMPAGQYVLIAVTDTGMGMTPEVAARAFDPFFTTKPVGQGTGLGLSQVYGFVKQSGGHVKIYSEAGQGTTVKIYLPRLLCTPEQVTAEEAPRELPRGESGEVVLVVEDEPVVRQFTVDALAELGYRVVEADGATAALRLLDVHPEVTLLFTDIVMPDTNGRKLADEALHRRPGLRVLFTTGYTRDAVVHNGVLDPGVHLLGKPFTVEQLAAKLREVLEEPIPSA